MGKSVLITGTSTGIGRATVERMADAGWTVFAGVRKQADSDELQRTVTGDVRPVMLDVTNDAQISEVVDSLRKELGGPGLDGLVNNAGVAEGGPIETTTAAAWRWHFDVNVFGLVNTTRECLPLLRSARGRVVNIASIGGRVASPMMAPYSAGKHAVEAISEALRFEVEGLGIKVACVEPGEIKTAIWEKADQELDRLIAGFDAETLNRYERQFDTLYGFLADGAKRGIPASKVADVVHHALTAERPKYRYLVGQDAKLAGHIAARLPDRLRHRVLSLNLSRWARAGSKLRSK